MKIGFLGCEHKNTEAYLAALRQIDGTEIVGIAESADKALGKELAARADIRWYGSPDALFADGPDAVIVCSATARHADLTVAAARAGKHVLVEKPIATTEADAERMIAECAKNHVMLMTAFPMRYSPAVTRMRDMILSGGVGRIVAVNAANHSAMPDGWLADPALSGGGSVMEQTAYVADLLHWILGCDIRNVYCKMATLIHDIPVEDCALVSLEFQNRVYAAIDASWDRPSSYPTHGDVTMEIVGTEGCVSLDAFRQRGVLYSNHDNHSRFVGWGDDAELLMLRDFMAAAAVGGPSPITGEDGLFALKIALMAYRSASCNEAVETL